MKFHTRDWLDNKELRRCSPVARAVLADLMCLAHEGVPYGYLADKVGKLDTSYMAARCILPRGRFVAAIEELRTHTRIAENADGVLYIPRMVEDENVRLKRSAGGSLGGNPKLSGKVNLPGGKKDNLPANHEVNYHSPVRARADSDSGSVSPEGVQGEPGDDDPVSTVGRFIQQYGAAMGVRLEPDIGVCFRITQKMFGAGKTIDDLEAILHDLIRSKQKPKGIGWVITVLEGRLEHAGSQHAASA